MKVLFAGWLLLILAAAGCQPAASPSATDTAAGVIAATSPAFPAPAVTAETPVAVAPALAAVAAVDETATDTALARLAMQRYRGEYARDGRFRVEDVQVRGTRAIGTCIPLTASGVIDRSRPLRLFVAVRANGRWTVQALGADIIDPWAEPISRIYGDA